jgi:hypothetical protein
MKEFLQSLGINIGISVAGLFGALLLVGKTNKTDLRTMFFSLLSGVASANYITPVILDMAQFDVKYQMSVAFILGFLGLKGVELISNKLLKKVEDESISSNQRDK